MATFYCYEEDGTVTASSLDPITSALAYGPSDPGRPYEERRDFVGAFLARRELAHRSNPVFVAPQNQVPPHTTYGLPYNQPVDHPPSHYVASEPAHPGYYANQRYDPSQYAESHLFVNHTDIVDRAIGALQPDAIRWYPDPEEIRYLYTLQDLLPNLHPERKRNAFEGQRIDIIEEGTGYRLAGQVPKKLLVLFLGRKVMNRFITSVDRRQEVDWRDDTTAQQMRLPRGKSSTFAFRILLRWMSRACRYPTMDTTSYIHIPKNLFAACSLASTMDLFGLYKDALRVDKFIANNHFVRPIFAEELGCIWNLLGESDRYVYAAIKIVSERLRQYEQGGNQSGKGIDDDMFALLKENPRLEARVRDLELNENYRPVFGTRWTKYLGENIEQEGQGSPESKCPDNQGTRLLEERPQPAGPAKLVPKFGIIRIVPAATKEPSKGDQVVVESSGKDQKW